MFDVFYLGKNNAMANTVPFAKQVNDVSDIRCQTKMYWLIEPHVEITDTDILYFRPADHDSKYEHIWKWNANNYGGVRLLPQGLSQGIKQINQVVCKKTFDILDTPDPGDYFTQYPYANYVWCVDPEYKLSDNIDWAPSNFEPDFIHSFHLRGQLEHKYPESEGGVKLYPRAWQDADIKYHGFLDASVKYPVLYVSDPEDYSERDIYDDDYVWLIDKEHKINPDTLDWVPNPFEEEFIHSFRMPYQLTDKTWCHNHSEHNPALGGIRLVPKNWKDAYHKIPNGVVIHNDCPVEDLNYDVFYIDDDEFTVENYSELSERSKTDWFWVVDREYEFNGKLLYVPAQHEQDYIHVFKIPGHLEERYPTDVLEPWDNRCGGVRLVHKNFDITKQKYQFDVCPVRFDIFYTDNLSDYNTFARKSRTKMFWLVDSEHLIDNIFRYVPHRYDQKAIQTFKIPNQLEHKYPKSVTNVSDNRCGGVKLVPVKYDSNNIKFIPHSPTGTKQYPILYVEDVNDYSIVTQDCWVIDKEYQFDEEVSWVPPDFQKDMIHTFHLAGQLEHKYPEEIGGIRWVPANHSNAEIVIHNISPFKDLEFEKFSTEEEGRANTKHDWFWVVDPDVDVVTDFDWDYIPDIWDKEKTHIWQKLNPVTGRQYDYGGVMLCPKVPQTTGRPKYIREPACTQKEFDILYLDASQDILEQLNTYQSSTKMFYVVDPWVQLHPDFKFDVYPTQWDQDCVHVFTDENGEYRNVRLVPMGYHFESLEQITNNSFHKLKEHLIVASKTPEWPVVKLQDVTVTEIQQAQATIDAPWFFTIDPDVDIITDNLYYEPQINDHGRVHAWQKLNPHTQEVHGYGGVRLWPTDQTVGITSDQLKLNKIPRLRYVRHCLSAYKPYPIILLSYHEERAQTAFDELVKRSDNVSWVRDVQGIFNAHKEAASQAGDSTMFWVVDADAELWPDFDFSYIPDPYDQSTVHVWSSFNPVTGSKYGYGGVKLFNTQQVLSATSWGLDFTTGLSKKFKFMPEVSCTTVFNTSAYDTWRSAFREVVKLSVSTDPDSEYRITEWLNPMPNAKYSDYAKSGAQEAQDFAHINQNNITELDKINDYEWLKQKFSQR